MTKVFIAIFLSSFVLLQSSSGGRSSERESDGFVGPVKQVLVERYAVSGFPSPPDARCRSRIQVYDKDGRKIQYSSFSNTCGSDERQEHYTYDQNGNRTIRDEFIRGKTGPPPPPPPMMPPGTKPMTGQAKTILKYNEKGMITEEANFRGNGDPLHKTTYEYDEKGRRKEMQVIHPNGTRYRWEYKYEGEKRFPESLDSFDGESSVLRWTQTYSDYELNRQGDWTRRRTTTKEAQGNIRISIEYQVIEYYPAKK